MVIHSHLSLVNANIVAIGAEPGQNVLSHHVYFAFGERNPISFRLTWWWEEEAIFQSENEGAARVAVYDALVAI